MGVAELRHAVETSTGHLKDAAADAESEGQYFDGAIHSSKAVIEGLKQAIAGIKGLGFNMPLIEKSVQSNSDMIIRAQTALAGQNLSHSKDINGRGLGNSVHDAAEEVQQAHSFVMGSGEYVSRLSAHTLEHMLSAISSGLELMVQNQLTHEKFHEHVATGVAHGTAYQQILTS